jgi:FtsP/CotA-like multicopper oxidase with cupredoxin domain
VENDRVAIAGHRITVSHADGRSVKPVEVDGLEIGMGERYDVIVDAGNPFFHCHNAYHMEMGMAREVRYVG